MQQIFASLKKSIKNSIPQTSRMFCENNSSSSCVINDPSSRIIWIDLELTGLDFEKDTILEAACVITEENLDTVAEGPNLIIHQPDEVLDKMGTWCQEQHSKTGLIQACINSTLTIAEADEQLCQFVQKYTPPEKCCLAGNTIYMDRLFIMKQLPNLNKHLHYRLIDVSTVKELCRRWNRNKYLSAPPKTFTHRAREDILESIEELRWYKKMFFK